MEIWRESERKIERMVHEKQSGREMKRQSKTVGGDGGKYGEGGKKQTGGKKDEKTEKRTEGNKKERHNA